YQSVFRLRVGNYRVLYTFGEGYVTPLTVDDRKDVYREGELVIGELVAPAYGVRGANELLETEAEATVRDWTDTRRPPAAPLPRLLDPQFLTQMRVDENLHAALRECRSVDDLCSALIPEDVRNRIFDAVMDPNIERILEQPRSSLRTSTS
ncbi:MAG: UvrD/REP helicase, partial [Acidimicrobiales bacterium]|nr:UvrD/REP helicase [Acidimicrobiales bacterium]